MSAPLTLTLEEARLVVAVGAYRAANGDGPGWGWLRERLGVDRHELDRMLHDLRRRGCVSFTLAEGSLQVDPAAARAAVTIVRDAGVRQREAELRATPSQLKDRRGTGVEETAA